MPPIIVTTRALIVHDNKLLMCKLRPTDNFYCLPGGKLEPGETIEAGMERELIEETAIKPEIGKLLFVNQFINADNHRVEFFFLITNGADYADFDYTKASHAHEITSFAMGDPGDPRYNLLPTFICDRFADIVTRGDRLELEVVVSN